MDKSLLTSFIVKSLHNLSKDFCPWLYECEQCRKRFKSKHYLQRHVDFVHDYKSTFHQPGLLEKHVNKWHITRLLLDTSNNAPNIKLYKS